MRDSSALGGTLPLFVAVRQGRPRRASTRPEASSASRSPLPRPSAASPRKRRCRRIRPFNYRSSLRRSHACEPGQPVLAQPHAPSRPATICSFLNLARVIHPSFFGAGLQRFLEEIVSGKSNVRRMPSSHPSHLVAHAPARSMTQATIWPFSRSAFTCRRASE